MLRSIGVRFMDVPILNTLENRLRQSNDSFQDRQLRVRLEGYSSLNSKKVSTSDTKPHQVIDLSEPPTKKSKLESVDDLPEPPDKKQKLNPLKPLVSPRAWNGKCPKKNLFKNLVLAMNLAFSDYDFSSVKLQQFRRSTLTEAQASVKAHLLSLRTPSVETVDSFVKVLSEDLWKAIEEVTDLPSGVGCCFSEKSMDSIQIYSYMPDLESESEIDADPFSTLGNLWAFNFFFCNPNAGKVVLLACSCRQRKFSQTGDSIPDFTSQHPLLESEVGDVSFRWEDYEEGESVESSNGEESVEEVSLGLGMAVAF